MWEDNTVPTPGRRVPDYERVALGEWFVYCPALDCRFQGERQQAIGPTCPDCGGHEVRIWRRSPSDDAFAVLARSINVRRTIPDDVFFGWFAALHVLAYKLRFVAGAVTSLPLDNTLGDEAWRRSGHNRSLAIEAIRGQLIVWLEAGVERDTCEPLIARLREIAIDEWARDRAAAAANN